MRIDTKEGRFYVNLPSKLFNKIKEIAQTHEDIDLAMLGLLLHFIITEKYKDKNLENGAEWVALNSQILRKYNYLEFKTKTHLEVLVNEDVLDYRKHYSPKSRTRQKRGKSRTYKIKDKYFEKASSPHGFNSSKLVKKISTHQARKRVNAEYKCEYLTNWLQHKGFNMDTEKAKAYVDDTWANEKYRREKRVKTIDNFNSYQTTYSREGKDDRLHSYFTSLPTDLKKFVKFEGQKLKEADIKNSQPFIFSYILEIIKQLHIDEMELHGSISLRKFSNKLYKVFRGLINLYDDEDYRLDIRTICNSITIMLQEAPKPIDFTEIDAFISLVRSGLIYEHVGEELFDKGSIRSNGKEFKVTLFDKDKNRMRNYVEDTLRKCAKKVTINAFYGSPYNKRVTAIEHFKELFPEVAKYLNAMKHNEKSDLPILMQRIESKCVLDHCSKRIGKKHPEMLLISRHDSLVTSQTQFEVLKREFQQLLDVYFKVGKNLVSVELGEEPWTNAN